MPPKQTATFFQELESGKIGLQNVCQSLTNIDVERAEATVKDDETRVKQIIQESYSFDGVNTAVKRSMKYWCTQMFSEYLTQFVTRQ